MPSNEKHSGSPPEMPLVDYGRLKMTLSYTVPFHIHTNVKLTTSYRPNYVLELTTTG